MRTRKRGKEESTGESKSKYIKVRWNGRSEKHGWELRLSGGIWVRVASFWMLHTKFNRKGWQWLVAESSCWYVCVCAELQQCLLPVNYCHDLWGSRASLPSLHACLLLAWGIHSCERCWLFLSPEFPTLYPGAWFPCCSISLHASESGVSKHTTELCTGGGLLWELSHLPACVCLSVLRHGLHSKPLTRGLVPHGPS